MAKQRIIINIEDDLSHMLATKLVMLLIEQGFQSETAGKKHYCHMTSFKNPMTGKELNVYSTINKAGTTYTFNIWANYNEDPKKALAK